MKYMMEVVLLATIVALSPTAALSAVGATPSVLITLTLSSMNHGVEGIFGFFRRRGQTVQTSTGVPQEVEEMPDGPTGPVSYFFPSRNPGLASSYPFGNSYSRPQIPGSYFQRTGFPPSYQAQMAQQLAEQQIPPHMASQIFQQMQDSYSQNSDFDYRPGRSEEMPPSMNTDEAESFFTLLSETDESQCISRLVCEMGADPANSGEFGQTITEIIGGLQHFPANSKASYYNEVMQMGVRSGIATCSTKFSNCDDESLQMVKNAQMSDSETSQ